jgi:hypothetical protein
MIYQASWAQKTTTVYGTIRDAKNSASLPFVNVSFVAVATGVSSTMEGNYRIETQEQVDSICFTFLGYTSKKFSIKKGKTQELNISLSESGLELLTATVLEKKRKRRVKDTAAIALWRKVVKYWPSNRLKAAEDAQFKDYSNTNFDWMNPGEKLLGSKLFGKPMRIMRNYVQTEENGDTYLPMLNKESIKAVYYRKNPKKTTEHILSDRFSGIKNEATANFLGSKIEKIEPFKNLTVLVGKSFIGPFSATSDIHYNYFLTDSVERDGAKYYLLTFVGKRKQDYTFLGNAWVHEPSFGVESIEMEISPHIALNHIHTINVQQQYQRTKEEYWVKMQENITTIAKVDFVDLGSRKNRNKKNQIRIRRRMKRYDLAINEGIDPHKLIGDYVQYAEGYKERDDWYWETNRPEPLDTLSQKVHTMIDSIQNTPLYKIMDYLTYASATSHLKAGPIEFGKFAEFVSWNDIEGLRLKMGVRTSKKLTDKIQVGAYAAYGFKDRAWKYGIKGKFHLPRKNRRWHMLSVQYAADFQMLGNNDHQILTNDNIIASITRATPINKLMFIRQGLISYEKDWFQGFHSRVGFRWRKFYAVDNGFQFTSGDGATSIPSFTTSEIKLKLHWGHKQKYWTSFSGFDRFFMGSRLPIVDFEYTAGIKGLLGGDYNYHKLDLSISQRFSTPFGYMIYKIKGGKIFGDAPYPLLKVHLGNQSILRNAGAYAMMNDFEFVSDAYGAVWVDYHFDGFILNTIPLINKLKWRSIFMFKGLYGGMRASNRALIDMPENINAPNLYAEIGFGIENIFKILRVDFMWRLTQLGQPNVRPFGVNIVFQPKF